MYIRFIDSPWIGENNIHKNYEDIRGTILIPVPSE